MHNTENRTINKSGHVKGSHSSLDKKREAKKSTVRPVSTDGLFKFFVYFFSPVTKNDGWKWKKQMAVGSIEERCMRLGGGKSSMDNMA